MSSWLGQSRVPPEPPKDAAPDYFEPLIGWRIWHVTKGGQIRAAVIGTTWPAFKALQATHDGHEQCYGIGSCHCGAYAYRTEAFARADMDDLGALSYIIGKVALWGRVAVHTRGYRASRAYPVEFLYAKGCDGAAVANAYGVPFTEDQTWKSVSENGLSSSSLFRSQYPFGNPLLKYLVNGGFLASSQPWSSPYLLRPDDHTFIVQPDPPEAKYPGLPNGMQPPVIRTPKRFQRPSGLWVPPGCGEPPPSLPQPWFTPRYSSVSIGWDV
jgi:hypothetical protein